MSVAQWVFVIIFLIIIPIVVFIIMETTGFLTPSIEGAPSDSLIDVRALLNPSGWSNTEPVEGPDGQCKLYDTPFLNVLNNASADIFPSDCENIGTNVTPVNCSQDIDTIIARKVRRRCKIPINNEASVPCINIQGNVVPPGTIEEYFEMCPGELSEGVLQLIEVGESIFGEQCLSVTNDDETLEVRSCDNDDPRQKFRITWRNNVDQASVTLSNLTVILKRPDIGSFAQIYHRQTAKYMNPVSVGDGQEVKLTDDPGFAWVRVPPEGDTVQQLAANINDVAYIRDVNPDPFFTIDTMGGTVQLAPGSVDDLSASTQKLNFINI